MDALTAALFDGRDLVTQIPESRWAHASYLLPEPGVAGKTYTFSAGVLDDLWSFDAAAFGISPREAAQMDPQQRLLLQVVYEALEDAGLPRDRLAGQQVGAYVGASTMTHGTRIAVDPLITDAYMMTGNTLSLVSNRISHNFDLRGPSMTVDTACSSSLYAFDLAEQALERGEIDTAIVAGSNVLLDPLHFAGFSAARMLSPTGRSRPFSADADGYVRAEGVVAFVLERKPMSEIAPRRPRAAILGVRTNADGRTLTAALPSLEGQASLLHDIYESAEVDPESLTFVEAHGTGTQVGDPVEATALGQVLGARRSKPLPIGSIKSNIGHLEPASGAAGVLKSLIAFEHGRYPKTLHAETLNPNIAFDDLNLALVREPLDLGEAGGAPRRAGVSSFGFGGANAHLILEAVPPAPAAVPVAPERPPVLMVSAGTEESLRKSLTDWSQRLRRDTPDAARLGEFAAEAQAHRALEPRRAAVLCGDAAATAEALEHASRGSAHPRVLTGQSTLRAEPTVFVFSGNGSQYGGMSRLALATDPVYAAKMAEIDAIFSDLSGWSVLERIESPTVEQELRDCNIAQPLLFADQVAQVAALAARGLKPAAVMGHSGGEVAAAHVAGVLSLADALALIYWRSLSQQRLRGKGTMAALQVGVDEARASLAEFGRDLHIAADNSPRSVTLVGSNEAVADYIRFARKTRRWACVKLDIDYPYHSPAQDEIIEELAASIAHLTPSAGSLPFISSVTGVEEPGERLDPKYWCDNVREPVLFREAMEALKEKGLRAYLEIGASPVLLNYMKSCIGNEVPNAAVIHGFEKQDSLDPVGRTLARAAVNGCGISIADLTPAPVDFDRSLTHYSWSNQVYRVDTTPTVNRVFGVNEDFHCLLGIEDGDDGATWRADLDLSGLPALDDHKIGEQALLPATAFAEVALAAAQRALDTDEVELRDLDITAPLRLTRGKPTTMRTSAQAGPAVLTIESQPRGVEAPWRGHARGRFYELQEPASTAEAPDPAFRQGDIDGEAVYAAAREIGLNYGPEFRRLKHLRLIGDDRLEVVLREAEPLAVGHAGVTAHALDLIGADAVFHGMIGALMGDREKSHGFLPVRIGRLSLFRSGATVASGTIQIRRVGRRSLLADFILFDATGAAIATLTGVRFQASQLSRKVSLAQHSYRFEPRLVTDAGSAAALALDEIVALTGEPGFDAGDDGLFLIEGVAQQIVLAAARGLADGAGLVAEPAGAGAYLRSAMSVLVRAGLAEREDAGWRLVAAEDEPARPMALVASLVRRRPDLGAEAALLARLAGGIGGFLAEAPESARAEFGREALANLSEGSVHVARRARLMVEVAGLVAARWPDTARPRIAEVTDGRAQLLPVMVDAPSFARAALTEIVAPARGDAGQAVVLPPERVERIETPEALGRYDLILVPGTFERAADPEGLARLLHDKLAPGGQVVVVAEAPSDFGDLVYGLDGDWFAGEDADGQPLSRLPVEDDLADLFVAAGFDGAEVAALPEGFGMSSLLVARAAAAAEAGPGDAGLEALIGALVAGESDPRITELDDAAMRVARPESGEIGAIAWFAGAPGADAAATISARLLALRDLAAELGAASSRLVAIVPGGTGQAPARAADPLQISTWDTLRVVVNEYADLRRLSVDFAAGIEGAAMAARLARHLAQDDDETEVILGAETAHGLRVVRGLPKRAEAGADMGAALVPPVTGGLDDLHWAAVPRSAPGPGEVEIEVAFTGLNFRDVMWAMGLLPEEALEKGFAGPTPGIEFSGRVARLGAGVKDFAVGDAVVGFGPASFATHRRMSTEFVARLPASISLEAAAAIPVAFFTAYYAMIHLARLSDGESVLIHGGAGGVGLAAVRIAQAAGATVIATAGTPVKRDLLVALGVDHVLDSRSLAFADQVMDITGGRGVDVVLNSLAGEAMEKSLMCMAPFGRFLELGKQDFYANTAIGLRPLKENVAYFGIDVDQLIADRPKLSMRLFTEMLGNFETGAYGPIPYRSFEGGRISEAFRLMQKAGHIGKIVLSPRGPDGLAAERSGRAEFAASPDGAHIVIGGLGGLGLEVGDWLVRRGARSLVLVGRKATPGAEAKARIARWRKQGVAVRLAACDVADKAALTALLNELRAEAPIRGVIHSAMVLEDMQMSALTPEGLARTLPAKVTGGANLDVLTRGDTLDYFVLFSSVAAMFGNHGQSAYVAGNGYLEGIARDRRAAGLPGLAVGWGAVTDAGYLTREGQQAAAIIKRATGDVAFTARNLTDALDGLLAAGSDADPVHYVSNMRWGALARTLRSLGEPTYRVLRALKDRDGEETHGDGLRGELVSLPRAKAEQRLSAFLVDRIANILRISGSSVKPTVPISELGVDSLMGVELGLTLEQSLGSDVPVSIISDSLNIAQISARIVAHLQSADAGPAGDEATMLSIFAQHSTEGDGEAPAAARGVGT